MKSKKTIKVNYIPKLSTGEDLYKEAISKNMTPSLFYCRLLSNGEISEAQRLAEYVEEILGELL